MTIIGFNYTKMVAEKISVAEGKVGIRNNVAITDVTKQELNLGSNKQQALKFLFEFTSDYDPKIGNVTLNGEVLYLADEKKTQEVLKEWKKEKKIQKELLTHILNNVLAKSIVQALILGKDVNLPSPLPLPTIKPETK